MHSERAGSLVGTGPVQTITCVRGSGSIASLATNARQNVRGDAAFELEVDLMTTLGN
jgi:hypothetical protein